MNVIVMRTTFPYERGYNQRGRDGIALRARGLSANSGAKAALYAQALSDDSATERPPY
jgi:hypothetical protein